MTVVNAKSIIQEKGLNSEPKLLPFDEWHSETACWDWLLSWMVAPWESCPCLPMRWLTKKSALSAMCFLFLQNHLCVCFYPGMSILDLHVFHCSCFFLMSTSCTQKVGFRHYMFARFWLLFFLQKNEILQASKKIFLAISSFVQCYIQIPKGFLETNQNPLMQLFVIYVSAHTVGVFI